MRTLRPPSCPSEPPSGLRRPSHPLRTHPLPFCSSLWLQNPVEIAEAEQATGEQIERILVCGIVSVRASAHPPVPAAVALARRRRSAARALLGAALLAYVAQPLIDASPSARSFVSDVAALAGAGSHVTVDKLHVKGGEAPGAAGYYFPDFELSFAYNFVLS